MRASGCLHRIFPVSLFSEWRSRAVVTRLASHTSSSPVGPKPVRDAAEVALDSADDVSVLCAGAPAAVDNSGEAEQQDGQGAAAAQQLQPLAAKKSLVLQRHTCERALRQHGPQQRVVLEKTRRHAAAAEDEKSRCGAERRRHVVAETLCVA